MKFFRGWSAQGLEHLARTDPGRGDWVQLKRGTVETKIKKGVRYLLVVLKKSPFEYHMGKQLCVEFG